MELLARSAFCISAALLALSDGVLAQNFTTQRVSLTSEGGESNGYSGSNSISADGARVAFDSTADNLVSGDTNGMRDIFLHDRSDGRTVRVSVGTGGLESNGDSLYPSISADGQFVAFTSYADNLVVGDTNGKTDVFLHDTLTGQTTRVSVSSQGEEANGISLAEQPWVLSGHGLLVGFSSFAENLVPGDSNGKRDAFVHDMQTGQTIRISVDSTGLQGNDDSGARICVSADGLCAIFDSWATNLGGGGTAPKQGVFFHDLVSGQTLRVSSPTWEGFGDQVSGDGHYVIYTAYDGFNYGNVFLYDRQTGQTSAIGVGALGSLPNGHCWAGSISLDGRFVALTSSADNMAPDFNQSDDVFLVDRSIAKTTLLSWGFGGAQLNLASGSSCLSADASTVSYASSAGRVVPFDQNVASDVFAVALTGCAPTVAAYCVPSATSIPGCEASLDGSGFPSLSNAAAFALSAAPMPGGTTGLMFWGLHGPRDQVFGTQGGRICVASPFARTLVQASGGTSAVCNGHIELTLQDLLATDPFQVQAGHTIHVQAWFRDAGSPDGFGLSSGVWFNVCP